MSTAGERGHVVVLGDSHVATHVAAQQAGVAPVVHAGLEPLPETAAATERVSEVALVRNPEALLRSVGAERARLLFVDLADDAATLSVVAAIAAAADRPEIVANIRDPALRRVVDDNLHATGAPPRPRIVSTASLTVAAAIATVRPWALADERGQDRVHAMVLGFSDLGRAAFEELILAGIAGDFGKPKLTIVDADPLGIRRLIDRDMPEIEVSADIQIATYDPLTLTAADGPLAAATVPVTLIVIALDDPAAALAAMTSIGRMQGR